MAKAEKKIEEAPASKPKVKVQPKNIEGQSVLFIGARKRSDHPSWEQDVKEKKSEFSPLPTTPETGFVEEVYSDSHYARTTWKDGNGMLRSAYVIRTPEESQLWMVA